MIKAILGIVVVVFLGAGTIIALEQLWRDGVLVRPAMVSGYPAAVAVSDGFKASGTLDYYPNNAGVAVPYLVYRNASGSVVTKALVFAHNSSCGAPDGTYPCPLIADALRTYFGGGAVQVTGRVVAEHVVVDELSTTSL
jgi:hypothetical protein